jgi:RNA polymerase sigma-70 factor (ECF subfamily)
MKHFVSPASADFTVVSVSAQQLRNDQSTIPFGYSSLVSAKRQQGLTSQPLRTSIEAEITASIPRLRAFAVSLCHNPDLADDLVQETLLSALTHLSSFSEGSNLAAWLFTILRNGFFSICRKRRREVEDVRGEFAAKLSISPPQDSFMALRDVHIALQKLPSEQSEAVLLVGGSGLSYDAAAKSCSCAIGTMKSRVSRGRSSLAKMIDGTQFADGSSFQTPRHSRQLASQDFS